MSTAASKSARNDLEFMMTQDDTGLHLQEALSILLDIRVLNSAEILAE